LKQINSLDRHDDYMTRVTKASAVRKDEVSLPKKPEDKPIEAMICDMGVGGTQSMRGERASQGHAGHSTGDQAA
jgi:hypothetical protein